MTDLSRWFERQARRERRAVYLEETLLGNRFAPYAVYRLRYFVARLVIASAMHAVTVSLLYRFFDRRHFAIVLVAYAAASAVGSFWWGSLEALRGEVRRLYRTSSPHRIPQAVGRWLTLALQLALLTAAGTAAWLAVRLAAGDAPGPAGLYVAAILLGLALQFVTRAYHSGIYAIRRIYRPLPAILGVEVAGVAVSLALAPFVGAWALPAGAFAGTLVVAGLSLHYTHRTYWFLGLEPERFVHLFRGALPRRRELREFLGGGFSYALMSLDSLLVLILFTTERDAATETGLFALFFLLSPTLRAASEWAQLFYFDLKRLEVRVLRNLRRRFERAVLRLAVVVGLLLAAVAVPIGALVTDVGLAELLTLVPFFVAVSLLSAVQVRAFTDRAYAAVAANGALCVVGYVAVALSTEKEAVTVLLLATVSLGGFCLLQFGRGPLRADAPRPLLWPIEWLADVASVPGPVRVAAARFEAAAPVSTKGDWRARPLADRVARHVSPAGRATMVEPGLLAWYERLDGARPGIGRRSLPSLGGGLLKWVGSSTGTDGPSALRAAAAAGLLGRELAVTVTRDAEPLDAQSLRAVFGRMFRSGIVFSPDERVPAELDALEADHKRVALAEAVSFSRELRMPRPRAPYQATSFSEAGQLRLVFLVSRRAPRRLQRRWEALLRDANLRAAMAVPASGKTRSGYGQ